MQVRERKRVAVKVVLAVVSFPLEDHNPVVDVAQRADPFLLLSSTVHYKHVVLLKGILLALATES